MNLSIFRGFHRSLRMLKTQDYYKVLGISKTSSDNDIKHAYFSLAKKFHPDINKSADAKEKFSLINSAYETLSNREKRMVYDRTGKNADEQEAQAPDTSDIEEFALKNQPKKKGSDIKISVELSFTDSLKDYEKKISYEKLATCTNCKGTRAKPGTSPEKCNACNGYGVVIALHGSDEVQETCENCSGLGKVVKSPCVPCKGQGLAVQKFTEKILIPAGVEHGYSLKILNKGNSSTTNGEPGDLILKILVKEHPVLKRKGFDLFSTVTLKPSQAILGGLVEIETISGNVQLEVTPFLKNCETIRLSNYGIPHLPPNQNFKGHHYVNFKIQIPKKLSPTQKKIFEDLAKIEKENQNNKTEKK